RDALLFDLYRPQPTDAQADRQPRKSMAVRLTFNAEATAPTESQIESAVASVLATLVVQLGACQRT
ncbi:MAG TPA: hypothetical protein PLB25_20570, partial [Rhodoferax sp.]|nr:hypothetical protein [Rhodoferax sp.]